MTTPSYPDWLTELIDEEGESKPMDVSERESLIGALQAAHAPAPLAQAQHQRILERALGEADPLAPPSELELEEAAKLRDHLDSDPLIVSLRAAHGSATVAARLETPTFETVVATHQLRRDRRSRVQVSAFWGALAIAATVALWVGFNTSLSSPMASIEPSQHSLAVSRSTGSLFSKPFDASSPSERIDKIAQVRARDLRNNRYAQWGLP